MMRILKYSIFFAFFLVLACSKQSDDVVGLNPDNYGGVFGSSCENPFIDSCVDSISTFSVDADGASYSYMRGAVNRKRLPFPHSVRIDEYLNYFTFNYAEPEGDAPIAINGEIGACPWNDAHKLLRLGIKGKHLSENQLLPSSLVFMVDVSGSMSTSDKLPLLKSGLKMLVDRLRPDDRISIVTYSGQARVVLKSVLVSESSKIKEVISDLRAGEMIAGGDALKMAYEQASANFIAGGNNRVVMVTDGDFNVGVTSNMDLLKIVSDYASNGIYMTVCGFGSANMNDAMMKTISNKGNGSYFYIDSEDELMKVFVNERSHFYSVANDVKVQVAFDKRYVKSWRLVGYGNRLPEHGALPGCINDGGEIGAGQTVTALYELELAKDSPAGVPMVVFNCRYKESSTGMSDVIGIEVSEPQLSARMLPELDFAAGVAAYGMILMDSHYKGTATLDMAEKLVASGIPFDEYGYRAELLELIGKARSFKR